MTNFRTAAIALVVGVLVFGAGLLAGRLTPHRPAAPGAAAPPASKTFAPPPDESFPDTPFGREAALGREIFVDTGRAAPQFVGNDLRCVNCHLDAGRLPNASPMWAAFVMFPQYRAKNAHVNTFQERMQGCFRFSMNGKAPPLGDKVLVALESYAAWLATGAPHGAKLPGQGYPKLAAAASAPDPARGRAVYQTYCAMCHASDGAGQSSAGAVVFPPLWGPRSYNWGAGMSQMDNAAAFIKANMPYSEGGRLTDQQAWDVAAYIDSRPRPQDPRYTGSVAATRAKFHDSAQSMYGKVVDGVLLGGDGPPKPFSPPAAHPPRGANPS
ncbi:MAG: c-type cytochrome [Alphaproteobacteria bacterium]|nr:c-type cytochrome [Alphaproteobacteria bacterium]